jgi:hypothetical protein
LVDVRCIRANPEPEAKAVAAVIAVHVDFGKLCLNLACARRPKGKKIAMLSLRAPWRNQICNPQSVNVLQRKPLDE